MPVLTKNQYRNLTVELNNRIDRLKDVLEARELRNAAEGCKKGSWVNPQNMCATKGSISELRIALADFATILNELSKLK